MNKKIGDKKIEGVQSSQQTEKVSGAETVTGVTGVKGAESISGVGAVGGVSKRRNTRVMSAAERTQLFQMINEEAEKLFGEMPEEQKKVVTDAVKMAINTGIIEEE